MQLADPGGARSPPLKPTKELYFTIILYNSENNMSLKTNSDYVFRHVRNVSLFAKAILSSTVL